MDPLFCGRFVFFRYNTPALVEGNQVVIGTKKDHCDGVTESGGIFVRLGLLIF